MVCAGCQCSLHLGNATCPGPVREGTIPEWRTFLRTVADGDPPCLSCALIGGQCGGNCSGAGAWYRPEVHPTLVSAVVAEHYPR